MSKFENIVVNCVDFREYQYESGIITHFIFTVKTAFCTIGILVYKM